jgi:hypothetical protein
LFPSWLSFHPWRWKLYDPPKGRVVSKLRCVLTQNSVFFRVIDVTTSNTTEDIKVYVSHEKRSRNEDPETLSSYLCFTLAAVVTVYTGKGTEQTS